MCGLEATRRGCWGQKLQEKLLKSDRQGPGQGRQLSWPLGAGSNPGPSAGQAGEVGTQERQPSGVGDAGGRQGAAGPRLGTGVGTRTLVTGSGDEPPKRGAGREGGTGSAPRQPLGQARLLRQPGQGHGLADAELCALHREGSQASAATREPQGLRARARAGQSAAKGHWPSLPGLLAPAGLPPSEPVQTACAPGWRLQDTLRMSALQRL